MKDFRRRWPAALVLALVSCGAATGCQKDQHANTPGGPSSKAYALEDMGAPAIRFSVKPEPPLGLTASDGTGLRLAAMKAQAVVDGSVAFTELHLTFDNTESRILEGRFRITLPPGASLQRFAMKIGNIWQESEVVELTAAREAYEDFLHKRQDPALLENAAGNEFSARVFPIPANARKELVVSYVQELREPSYVLPLKGLPEMGQLDARVTVVGETKQAPGLTLTNDKPSSDFVVDVRSLVSDTTTATRAGELVVARVKPQAESKPDPLTATIVLVDTSASRALGFEDELRTVAVVAARAAAAHGQLVVASFDQQVTPIYDGPADKFGSGELTKLRTHGALGASNLQRALEWAGETAKKGAKKRVVLVTDGVATAGATDSKRLTAVVGALRASGIERVDAVATGGIRDDSALLKLVRNNLPRDGVVVQATDAPAVIARRLDETTRSGVPVAIEGATWSWPTKLDGVQAGDEVSIYAELPAGKPVKIALDGKPAVAVEARTTTRPLLERVVAQAQVASLLEREITTSQDLKKEITALAVRHRVLTPYTAMLVLETEEDYARFRIDRRAPPEVLAIDDGKIIRVARANLGSAMATRPIELADPPGRPTDQVSRQPARNAPQAQAGAAPMPAMKDAPKPKMAAPAKTEAAAAGFGSALSAAAGPAGGASSSSDRVASAAAARPAPAPTSAPPPSAAPRGAPARSPAVAAKPSRSRERGNDEEAKKSLEILQRAQRDLDSDEGGRFAQAPPPPPPPRDVSGGELAYDGERVPAYAGRFKDVMDRIHEKDVKAAYAAAVEWRSEEPADVMALIALGEAAEALGALRLAARAYGSVVDLFPNRADLRRFAGERLERLADPGALELAIDTFSKARTDRPDHPASHRLLAFAYLRARQPEKAFEVLVAAIKQGYPSGRFRGVDRILREDLGLAAAAWIRTDPKREEEIRRLLLASGGSPEDEPSLRFVLVWETDANDVDFHVYDGKNNHAFYSHRELPTGGMLYADVTTGYGPECFTIRGAREERTGPYRLQAHYYSRGPMGYGMGKLQVVDHDGKGGLKFDERPFVVMNDHAFVDLGTAE